MHRSHPCRFPLTWAICPPLSKCQSRSSSKDFISLSWCSVLPLRASRKAKTTARSPDRSQDGRSIVEHSRKHDRESLRSRQSPLTPAVPCSSDSRRRDNHGRNSFWTPLRRLRYAIPRPRSDSGAPVHPLLAGKLLANNVAAQQERLNNESVSWLRRVNPLDDSSYSFRGRQLMVAARHNVLLGLLCGSIAGLAAETAQRLAVSPPGSNLGNAPLPAAISAALVILFLSAVIATIGIGLYSVANFILGWRARKSSDASGDGQAVSTRTQLRNESHARALRGLRWIFWTVSCAVVTLTLLRSL